MFENFDYNTLLQMISIGLLFILFITKAYKKSITTTIYIFSISISLICFTSCDAHMAALPIIIGAMISLARAIVLDRKDRFMDHRTDHHHFA